MSIKKKNVYAKFESREDIGADIAYLCRTIVYDDGTTQTQAWSFIPSFGAWRKHSKRKPLVWDAEKSAKYHGERMWPVNRAFTPVKGINRNNKHI